MMDNELEKFIEQIPPKKTSMSVWLEQEVKEEIKELAKQYNSTPSKTAVALIEYALHRIKQESE